MPWYLTAFAVFLLFYPVITIWLGLLRDKGNVTLSIGPLKLKLLSFRILTSWHWSLALALYALFLGIPGLILFSYYTCISWHIIILATIILAFTALLQWPYFSRRSLLAFQHFLVYCAGFGIWAGVFLLAINYFIPLTPSETNFYSITHCSTKYMRNKGNNECYAVELDLEAGAYDEYSRLRTFNVYTHPDNFYTVGVVELTTRRGILGMEVLRGYRFPAKIE